MNRRHLFCFSLFLLRYPPRALLARKLSPRYLFLFSSFRRLSIKKKSNDNDNIDVNFNNFM